MIIFVTPSPSLARLYKYNYNLKLIKNRQSSINAKTTKPYNDCFYLEPNGK